jgi:hypothetical protein
MNVFEVAAILAVCALAWLALGRFRRGFVRWVVLAVAVLLMVRSLTG